MEEKKIIYLVKKKGIKLKDLLKEGKITPEQYTKVEIILDDEELTNNILEMYELEKSKIEKTSEEVKKGAESIKDMGMKNQKKLKKISIIIIIVLVLLMLGSLLFKTVNNKIIVNKYNNKVEEINKTCSEISELEKNKSEVQKVYGIVSGNIDGDYYSESFYNDDYSDDYYSDDSCNQYNKIQSYNQYENLQYDEGINIDILEEELTNVNDQKTNIESEIDKLNENIETLKNNFTTVTKEDLKSKIEQSISKYVEITDAQSREDGKTGNTVYGTANSEYKGSWYKIESGQKEDDLKNIKLKVYYEITHSEEWSSPFNDEEVTKEKIIDSYVYNITLLKDKDNYYLISEEDPVATIEKDDSEYTANLSEYLEQGYKEYKESEDKKSEDKKSEDKKSEDKKSEDKKSEDKKSEE